MTTPIVRTRLTRAPHAHIITWRHVHPEAQRGQRR
jgi:hypothetical protein